MNSSFQQYLKANQVNHIIMRGANKASLAELYNKILKARIYRYLTFKKTKRYIDQLQLFVRGLNSRYLDSIGCAPDQVTVEKQPEIFKRKYEGAIGFQHRTDGLPVGAYVRVKLTRLTFGKSFTKQFSDEIFRIMEKNTYYRSITYELATFDGESISGRFYAEQLSPVVLK